MQKRFHGRARSRERSSPLLHMVGPSRVRYLTHTIMQRYISVIRQVDLNALAQRRVFEDELLALGAEREALAQQDSWNRERIRRLVAPTREVGITVRDIARLTGLSTQTLHTWMKDNMRPIPDIHLGLAGPAPRQLEQAVLRTMGQDSYRDWTAADVRARIPAGWPTGSLDEVDSAMQRLARWHMIWDGDVGYRVAPPDGTRNRSSTLDGEQP